MEISSDSQPAKTLTKNAGNFKFSLKVTTDSRYETVTMIDAFAEMKEIRRVNVGTVIEPNFQMVEGYYKYEQINCK